MQRFSLTTALATVILSSMLAGTAFAQAIPDAARPDTAERRYRAEPSRPDVGGAPLISVQAEEAKSIAGGVAFQLNGITITGSKTFAEADLKPFYQDKIGKKVTLNELNAIATKITNHYRNSGFILTRAVVPPQRAEGGIVTIRIVEGYVNKVTIQGDKANDPLVQKYAAKIQGSKPLNAATLERYLLLMEDLPGVQARAVLQPSPTEPGASDVIVTLERQRFEFLATTDNRGSRYLGPIQGSASVFVNNLLGLNDQTQVRMASSFLQPEELLYGEVRHEEQLGSEGTKLLVSASHVRTEPGFLLEALSTEGESNVFTAGVSHPITRSRQSNWFVNSDVTMRNVSVDNFAGDVYYDKTRVWTVGTSYDFLDSTSAINRMEAAFGKGFAFGTSSNEPASRGNGENSFEKFTAKISRIQPISGPWAVYGAVGGQYSLDPLLASEEYAIGGSEFGSAYDPAEISGDSGVAARAEIQFNQARDSEFMSAYQLYTFYDIGKVWNQDVGVGGEFKQASLSSAGVGARFNILESLSGGIEGAMPLTRDVATGGTDGNAPRVFFNLQYRY